MGTQWSSCSDKDFTTWWKEKGHVCLKKTTDKQHGDSYDDSDYDTIETDEPDSSHYDDSDYDTKEMFRVRNCKHQTPSNGFSLCPGPSIESKDCPPGPGPDSGDWGKWW